MQAKEFPILEFDENTNALIKPSHAIQPMDIAEGCVLCFFGEAIEKILDEYPHRVVQHFIAGSVKLPIYEVAYKGGKVCLHQAYVGAPGAASQIAELTALGCRKFIACGGCGVLRKDIVVGHLLIPTVAVRDEGTSYHYVKPAREIVANERVVQVIEQLLARRKIPYTKVKTWTTDAFYRETPSKIQLRKSEGCVTVEMEAAAFFAVSQYSHVDFGQILYAGDSVAGAEWDERSWSDRADIRESVLRLALDCCLAM